MVDQSIGANRPHEPNGPFPHVEAAFMSLLADVPSELLELARAIRGADQRAEIPGVMSKQERERLLNEARAALLPVLSRYLSPFRPPLDSKLAEEASAKAGAFGAELIADRVEAVYFLKVEEFRKEVLGNPRLPTLVAHVRSRHRRLADDEVQDALVHELVAARLEPTQPSLDTFVRKITSHY